MTNPRKQRLTQWAAPAIILTIVGFVASGLRMRDNGLDSRITHIEQTRASLWWKEDHREFAVDLRQRIRDLEERIRFLESKANE